MELKHSVSSNRSILLEEIPPASHFWATNSLGPHAWSLLWTAWLTNITASPLSLTADSLCNARNTNKSLFTFFQLFFFFFNSHLWKISYCWNLVLILNKRQLRPFPLLFSLQLWKWDISAGWKFWLSVCPFTKLPWILTEQSNQQATSGAVDWMLDWQSNSKGEKCIEV